MSVGSDRDHLPLISCARARLCSGRGRGVTVVGGGQAGLSVSHYLKQLSADHVVLEQADKPGEAWRNHRWDSFALNTPRWQSRLPRVRYGEDDPDGFMSRREVVTHLDEIAQRLPVRARARVVSVARDTATGDYVVSIDGGEKIRARNVVVATGLYQTLKIPELGRDLPAGVRQLHFDSYRNPGRRSVKMTALGAADARDYPQYLVPTIGDVPPIDTYIIEDREPLGPFGAKGVGEPALVPTAPAVLNAIRHATRRANDGSAGDAGPCEGRPASKRGAIPNLRLGR